MKQFDNLEILNINGSKYKTRLSIKYKNKKAYKVPDPSLVLSFIPGTVVKILVKEGQQVSRGESLVIIDAMKMQNHLKAGVDGKVRAINVKAGERVPKGMLLMELE